MLWSIAKRPGQDSGRFGFADGKFLRLAGLVHTGVQHVPIDVHLATGLLVLDCPTGQQPMTGVVTGS